MNPLQVLHYHCHIGLTDLHRMVRIHVKRDNLRKWVQTGTCSDKVNANLFYGAMVEWGKRYYDPYLSNGLDCRGYSPDIQAMGDCKHCGHTPQAHDVPTNAAVATMLWQAYFPEDSKPNVYQLLHFVFDIPVDTLCKWTGMAPPKILKILRGAKITQQQLQKIGRATVEYIDTLASDKSGDGEDLRYRWLELALRDHSRIEKR